MHVTRTHRVDLYWLFDRLWIWVIMLIKHGRTSDQLADILTEGMFTTMQWRIHCLFRDKSDDHESIDVRIFFSQPLLLQLQQRPKQCLSWWHKPNMLTRCGTNTLQRCWNQIAFWVIAWPWSNWVPMSSHVHKTRERPSWRNPLRHECGVEPLAGRVLVSDLQRQTGLLEIRSSRRWIVESAQGWSSPLLRFCFMHGKNTRWTCQKGQIQHTM